MYSRAKNHENPSIIGDVAISQILSSFILTTRYETHMKAIVV